MIFMFAYYRDTGNVQYIAQIHQWGVMFGSPNTWNVHYNTQSTLWDAKRNLSTALTTKKTIQLVRMSNEL